MTKDYCVKKMQAGMMVLLAKKQLIFLFPLQAREQFEAQLDEMSRIKSRLADRSVNSELNK